MKIEKVRDVTTKESAITHEVTEVTLRVSVWDYRDASKQDFSDRLASAVVRAINGIHDYPITFERDSDLAV